MATPPFGTALVEALKGKTAWRFESELGPVFTPRFFCCDNPNALGITEGKTPIANINDLSPNPAFLDDIIIFDGTASYDVDDSITDFDWTFEDHVPPTGTVPSGTLDFGTAVGTFTIELIVTDGLGIPSAPARIELVIKNMSIDIWAATSNGLYHGTGSTPTWTSKDSGLSGDDLNVNDVTIDPATQFLVDGSKTIWRATAGGVQVSNDGGANWAEKNPGTVSNQWSDGTAPTVADLEFQAFEWAGSRLFVAATWLNTSDYRSWVFHTDDAADMRAGTAGSVTWTEITTNWEA